MELKIGDVDFAGNIITVNNGKGNVSRLVPFRDSMGKWLKNYNGKKAKPGDTYFFESPSGGRRSNGSISKTFRKTVLPKAGISRNSVNGHSRGPCIHSLRHTFACNALDQMIKEGKAGSIVNTASMSAHIINTPQTIANYCASKGGVLLLTKALAVEWAKYNIRVNCVSPGYMATELVAEMKDMHEGWISKIPAGRLGVPKDLIGAYLYLLSDAARYTTGTDLIVDGGYTSL